MSNNKLKYATVAITIIVLALGGLSFISFNFLKSTKQQLLTLEKDKNTLQVENKKLKEDNFVLSNEIKQSIEANNNKNKETLKRINDAYVNKLIGNIKINGEKFKAEIDFPRNEINIETNYQLDISNDKIKEKEKELNDNLTVSKAKVKFSIVQTDIENNIALLKIRDIISPEATIKEEQLQGKFFLPNVELDELIDKDIFLVLNENIIKGCLKTEEEIVILNFN